MGGALMFVVCCSPTAQPAVDVGITGIAGAAAANGVAGDELEVQLYFRPTVPQSTAFGGDIRRIALWSRMEPSTLRVQLPEVEFSSVRLVVRVPRLCSGSTIGFQTVGEGSTTIRFTPTFARISNVSVAAMSVTRATDCSGTAR